MAVNKRVLCGFVIFAITLSSLAGCKETNVNISKYYKPSVSVSDNDWEEATENIVLENDRIIFDLDAQTTHFKVTDKQNGKVYTSVPSSDVTSDSFEIESRMFSEVTLSYYEEQSDVMFMYSDMDCVQKGDFKVKTNGEAIRVEYSIGAVNTVVPEFFDVDTFNKVMDMLDNAALRRRFERYYILYSSHDKPDDYEEKSSKYPILKKQEIYILDDEISDIDKDDIASYISETDFTEADYKAMLSRLGIKEKTVSDKAGYIIPIEYRLDEGGFSAEILTDRIVESSDKYKLQTIYLLEYFGANDETVGSYFVPDGSGAIIDFKNTSGSFSAPYYGEDYSTQQSEKSRIEKNLSLPVFGATLSDGGYFAEITSAAEAATLNVCPMSDASPLNHAYISFEMRSIDITDYGAEMSIPIYNLFSKKLLSTSPRIKYTLLSADKNTYMDMAKIYREEMIKNGALEEASVKNAPVYIDYLCMITEEASMMGVAYTEKKVLSSLENIINSVKKMHDAGVGPCIVRLIGYGSEGYSHSAYTKFELDKKVGTTEQLLELQKLLVDNGGKLFLDADMQFAYQSGNGFSVSDDTARYLNKLVVCRGQRDIVTKKYDASSLLRYFISPCKYPEYTSSLCESVKEKLGENSIGFSYSTTGHILGGDYAKNRDMNRSISLACVKTALDNTKEQGIDMMFDNGNAYVLPFTKHITNAPAVSSLYDVEKCSVPFYQAVLHGSVSYAGTPVNMSVDNNLNNSSSLAYGSAPYVSFITESDSLIANTSYDTMWYSLNDDVRIDGFIESVKKTQGLRQKVSDASIVEFEQIDSAVTHTVYSNGVEVYVNHSDRDISFRGTTISAYGFVSGGE